MFGTLGLSSSSWTWIAVGPWRSASFSKDACGCVVKHAEWMWDASCMKLGETAGDLDLDSAG